MVHEHQQHAAFARTMRYATTLLRLVCLLAAFTFSAASVADDVAHPGTCDLEVIVKGAASAKGEVQVELFASDQAGSFPKGAPRLRQRVPATGKAVTVWFRGVPYGTYAIVAYHDENANKHLDRYFFGMPKERWGVTGKRPTFGPPRFADSAFTLNAPHLKLVINVE